MKNISFKLSDDVHKKIKLRATNVDATIKDYLISLALNDIESEEKRMKDIEFEKIMNDYKKIYDQCEIVRFLSSFDKQKIAEVSISTSDFFNFDVRNVEISTDEDTFYIVAEKRDLHVSAIKFKDIKSLRVDEEGEYANVTILLESTRISFMYKNL